jgi:outer membrane protein TolC
VGLFDKLTGTQRPAEGVTPASPREVQAALLGLNRPDLPYVIRDGAPEDADLVAEWRLAEPTWQTFFVQSQLSRAIRIRIRLNHEDHEVRALEEAWELSRVGNPPRLKISSQYTRGPSRTVSTHRRLQRGDDGSLEARETFHFDSSDLVNPLRDTVLKSGWIWRGVVFGKL